MTRSEFLSRRHKAVTLLGFASSGKTELAHKLPKTAWFHYSSDYRIGTHYLQESILDNIKVEAMRIPFLRDLLRSDSIYIASNVKVHNLEPIAAFLGQVGRPARGGLPLQEFKRRQRLHREAEIGAQQDVAAFIEKGREIYGYDHFVNDTTDSFCELEDAETEGVIAAHTLIVYLEPEEAREQLVAAHSIEQPRPVRYQEAFLDAKLDEFMAALGAASADEIDPGEFARWVQPALIVRRAARYSEIAARHGYTVDARQAAQVENESDFLELIGSVL